MHPPVSAKNFNDFSASLKGRTNHSSKFSFMQAFEKRDWEKKSLSGARLCGRFSLPVHA